MKTSKSSLALPGNPRYQPKQLVPDFGYDNLAYTIGEVELATLRTLGEIGVIPPEVMKLLTANIEREILAVTTTLVDKMEREVTHHDIRAWVRIVQEIVGPKLAQWIHIPLTSYDPISTGRNLQFIRAHNEVVIPSVRKVITIFINLIKKFADTVQIGRTHGQHALPITVGFWFATILDRILRNTIEMDRYAQALEGKISGAVGAHNAQFGLGISELCGDVSFEARVLEKLGLKPAPISTQILPPEGLTYYLFSATMLSMVFAQFGMDGRHLMRSEIGEICEAREIGAVGSSTMPNKINPIKFEQEEGMSLKNLGEFLKVLLITNSEHQRDLVGSSVARDFPTIIVNLQTQMNTLLKKNDNGYRWLERLTVNEEALARNLEMSKGLTLAEPMYIALQMAGYEGDAHELINDTIMPLAKKKGLSLVDALSDYIVSSGDGEVNDALSKIPQETMILLSNPETYIGDAEKLALDTAQRGQDYLASA